MGDKLDRPAAMRNRETDAEGRKEQQQVFLCIFMFETRGVA